ncbi:DMSO/selenate family reductase complex B subunit [Raoultibacter timonensis]|uniref:DMSO/selenate family reductase complex B subunit n=1 Tax=Raoultibacter timonensis TaxID=1907662 RepID=UPI000C842386|nr:DMSO/selenate family reductase complex B subunit [Raoultibacter timonensis]
MQYGFYFDSARCTGCKTCMLACKDYKDLGADVSFRKVFDYEGGAWAMENGAWRQDAFMYHLSISCNHCGNPVCVHVCPTGAMHKDEHGLVLVDTHVCVGCGYCELSCPYGAPKVSEDTRQSTKCDGCVERILEGLDPICVRACPMRALDFGEISGFRQKASVVNSIAPMPDPVHTSPNIVIRPCPAAREPGDLTGHVANEKEV